MHFALAIALLTTLTNPPERLPFSAFTVETTKGSGSGVAIILRNKLHVLTCAHVLAAVKEPDGSYPLVTVINAAGQPSEATVLWADDLQDFAILCPGRKDYPALPAYPAPPFPRRGDRVWACASPNSRLWAGTLTSGTCSTPGFIYEKVLFDLYSIPSWKGSSGGGVYDYQGRLLGLIAGGFGESYTLVVPYRVIAPALEKCP